MRSDDFDDWLADDEGNIRPQVVRSMRPVPQDARPVRTGGSDPGSGLGAAIGLVLVGLFIHWLSRDDL